MITASAIESSLKEEMFSHAGISVICTAVAPADYCRYTTQRVRGLVTIMREQSGPSTPVGDPATQQRLASSVPKVNPPR